MRLTATATTSVLALGTVLGVFTVTSHAGAPETVEQRTVASAPVAYTSAPVAYGVGPEPSDNHGNG